jgi:hypothetical protein
VPKKGHFDTVLRVCFSIRIKFFKISYSVFFDRKKETFTKKQGYKNMKSNNNVQKKVVAVFFIFSELQKQKVQDNDDFLDDEED